MHNIWTLDPVTLSLDPGTHLPYLQHIWTLPMYQLYLQKLYTQYPESQPTTGPHMHVIIAGNPAQQTELTDS